MLPTPQEYDEITKLAREIKRLASAEHFDYDDLGSIWKAANRIEAERKRQLDAEAALEFIPNNPAFEEAGEPVTAGRGA